MTSLLLSRCSEPKPYVVKCIDGIVPYEEAGGTIKSFSINNDDMNLNERAIVIQSQIEYNSYLVSSSFGNSPQIDFRSKTLLVGRLHTVYSTGLLRQEIVSHCEKKIIDYNIELYKKADAGKGNTNYYAVIPKISEDTKVNFNVTISE
ncbi:hypothetical protein [Dyadobacter sp. CY323]|uniref:hypothetical protein n=1 Tax=Dyadobacter sp. CY323 TaxID=2907302 RepID=UPI001F3FBA82|nr:hypothetical protein [Dyadobacter sp. CY323]MCE6993196.1 hypothetical protein [Dyadobacter sp. CY323]